MIMLACMAEKKTFCLFTDLRVWYFSSNGTSLVEIKQLADQNGQ